jgi:hypothetical protein
MARALIVIDNTVSDWLRLARRVEHDLRVQGHNSSYLDVSSFSWPRFGNLSTRKAHGFLGGKVVRLTQAPKSQVSDHNFEPNREAINSSTFSVLQHIGDTWMSRKIRSKLRRKSEQLFEALTLFLSARDNVPDIVVIPNGRFSHQAVVRIAFGQLPKKPSQFFYEMLEGKLFLQSFQPHDRISRQKAINAAEIDLSACEAFVDSWLEERRRPGSKTNKFSAGWVQSQENLPKAGNLFLTSSTDEYWALGSQWHEADWADQYEAFDVILSKLESMGEENSILRIHPNLLNKSIRFIRTEKKRIEWLAKRHPNLKVLGPKNPANTYSLMESARRVFVSISTAGLEASASGKPVWCVMSTNYDLVADVRRIHSAHAATDDHLQVWDVDSKKAKKFIGWMDKLPSLDESTLAQDQRTSRILEKLISTYHLGFLYFTLIAARNARSLAVSWSRRCDI